MKFFKHPAVFFLILLALIVIPHFVSAQVAQGIWPTGFWGPLLSCTGDYTQQTGTCSNLCDLIGTIINVLYFIISICVFILGPLFLVVGGIMVMVSGANPEMLSKGKKTVTASVIGLVIVLCSYLIVAGVVKFLNITGVGGFSNSACPIQAAPANASS